jgi:hypothetical protein
VLLLLRLLRRVPLQGRHAHAHAPRSALLDRFELRSIQS